MTILEVEDSYSDKDGVIHEFVVKLKVEQVDHLDDNRQPFARFEVGSSEDHLRLGGHFQVTEVVSLLHRDGSQVPKEVRDFYRDNIPQEPFFLTLLRITLSKLEAPPAATPEAQAFQDALRQGITRHLSRPFARAFPVTTTQSRDVNGIEQTLLSRGRIDA